MTKNGIEYNLKISPYVYKLGDNIFYFSSKFYKDKFIASFENNRLKSLACISKFLLLSFDNMSAFDISLYAETEKRGFLINNKKLGWLKCLNQIKLNGEIRTKPS